MNKNNMEANFMALFAVYDECPSVCHSSALAGAGWGSLLYRRKNLIFLYSTFSKPPLVLLSL